MEGLHVVGGVTPAEKISIIYVLNLYVMHVCAMMLECYHVFHCVYEFIVNSIDYVW
jgi:hypothetical protein